MVKMILHGCSGRMGRMIQSVAASDDRISIAAGIDRIRPAEGDLPFFLSLDDCDVPADVLVDFSLPEAADKVTDYCVKNSLPLVMCTTGLSDAQVKKLKEASKQIPVLRSANMSVGVNLLIRVLKEVSKKLSDEGFDIEIVEKHHNQKKDAPSGTALALADAVKTELEDFEYVYDRSGRSQARPKKEIGISAVRGGTIPGDHDVIFAGEDEVITFSHRAYSRAVFAKGAVTAALFLAEKKKGLYTMEDVLGG